MLTKDFGKGFTQSNFRNIRQFYLTFNNSYALRSELSWNQYRLLMRLENEEKIDFYIDKCIKSNWSTRQLERQLDSGYFERYMLSTEKLEPVPLLKVIKDNFLDAYVLEFLNLPERFSEYDFKKAIIGNLKKFILEG